MPNAVGAVATHAEALSSTTIQDIVAGVTVGTISLTTTTNNGWFINPSGGSITLNQDGAGSGHATISNANPSTQTANTLVLNTGTLTLADDLLISLSGGTAGANGAVRIASTIGGAGNVTLSGFSTGITTVGSIHLQAANNFTGSVLVKNGTVAIDAGSSLGNTANAVTLGQSGQGRATILINGAVTVPYDINVAAGAGNTLSLVGYNVAASEFSGKITANGDLNVGGLSTTFSNTISGAGGVGKNNLSSGGTVILTGPNTYLGPTRVSFGSLLINGDQSAATGAVSADNTQTVNGSGTIGGIGTIGGAVTINQGGTITGAASGTVGALTLTQTAAFSGVSGDLATYQVDISGATSDKLAIMGLLDLTNAFDQISFSGSANGTSTYILASYSSVNGTFDTVTNLPSNYQLIYGATELDLAPIPEPGTWLAGALSLGVVIFALIRRLPPRGH